MPPITAAPVAEPTTSDDRAWQAQFDATEAAVFDEIVGGLLGDEAPPAKAGRAPTASASRDDAPKASGDAEPGTSPEDLAKLLDESRAADESTESEGEDGDEPTDEAPEEPAAGDKSATTALLKILEKERSLTTEREAFRAEREAWEAEKTAWTEQESKRDTIDGATLKKTLLTRPAALLQALGITPSQVSKLLIAEQLGDKAPPELRAEMARAQETARLQELEDRITGYEQKDSARAFADNVKSGVAAYVTKGVSAHCPTVAAVQKVDPQRVQDEIFQEIVSDASRRAHREPNGKPLSAEQAAARVEKRWAVLGNALKSQNASVSTADARKNASPSGASTAPTAGLAATPSLAPSKIAPRAPSLPWKDPTWEAQEEAALQEALASLNHRRR